MGEFMTGFWWAPSTTQETQPFNWQLFWVGLTEPPPDVFFFFFFFFVFHMMVLCEIRGVSSFCLLGRKKNISFIKALCVLRCTTAVSVCAWLKMLKIFLNSILGISTPHKYMLNGML